MGWLQYGENMSGLGKRPSTMAALVAEQVKSFPFLVLAALMSVAGSSVAVEPSTDQDVVIVGAGVSGLYAAYTLNNLGSMSCFSKRPIDTEAGSTPVRSAT